MLLLISSCSKWQLSHQKIPHKIPFGPLFWCQIIVEGDKVEREVSKGREGMQKVGSFA